MSEHMKMAIQELQAELAEKEAEVVKTKELINMLCTRSGIPPLYPEADLQTGNNRSYGFRSDQFYGQPLSKSLREILVARKAADIGPATVKELYDALAEGGYRFETKNADNAMRGLRISLRKNSSIFHKLPNGKWGLLAWYPGAKEARNSKAPKDSGAANDEDEGEDDENEDFGTDTDEGEDND